MRQHMRRFTRLTNGHSKKIDNHVHMVALYTTWYHFARINSSVRMSPGNGGTAYGVALGYRRHREADRGFGGDGSSCLVASAEKPIFFLVALVLGIASIYELSAPHIGRPAPNEVVVWVNRAAMDADFEADFEATAKKTAKQPVLKIPNDFDPDRI